MATPLEHISIEGFKSIQRLKEFPLRSLNVLVGSNGAGKSNFVDFFRMLRPMSNEGLANFIREGGGADGYFFNSPKVTPEIKADLHFGEYQYKFALGATVSGEMTVKDEDAVPSNFDGKMTVKEETTYSPNAGEGWSHGGGPAESQLKSWRGVPSRRGSELSIQGNVASIVSGWMVYHFQDTSPTAPMRREQPTRDFRELRSDAGNIAAFLHHLHGVNSPGESSYRRIREMVQLIVPFFDDFLLVSESKGANEVIRLEWQKKGNSLPFQPWQLSDGTIRFICLATALLQPDPPSTIVIDEAELGLHPFALDLLASLMKEAATRTQLIVATQSPTFLNAFEPEDVVVVDRQDGASRFRRLEAAPLADWLKEYTLGDLMQKNVIEAGPSYA